MAPGRRTAKDVAESVALLRRGLAESHRGEWKALQTLAAALDALQADGDAGGAALAAAALLVTGQCMQSYRRFAERAGALSGLREGSIAYADHADALIAHTGLLCALLMLSPSDPFIDICVERIMALLELDVDVNAKFAAGRLLIYYVEPREKRELALRVYGLLQPLTDDAALTPHRLGRWLIVWIRCTADAKDLALHRRAREQARELAQRHEEPEVVTWLAVAEIEAGLKQRDFARVERALDAVEKAADPASSSDASRLAWLKGRFALAKGEGDAALFHAARARQYALELEVPPPMLGVRLALEAQARLSVGDFAGARSLFERTAGMVAVLHAEEMRDMIRMVDAREALHLHRSDGRDLLVAAFAAPRARQFYDTFDTNPTFGATMCALALEHGIETKFVRRIIEVHGFAAPPEAGAEWPWPLKIVTFGRFELFRDDAVLALAGKTQKKPLELLKALIALGGHGTDRQRLADFLWAEAEPDAASAALDMAMLRLRKLIALPDAIRIEDGKVRLDPAQVWVDAWAFDRDVETLQALLHAASPDAAEVARLGERLFARYRGAFLDDEEPRRWLLAARDRWRNRFLRSLSDAGRYWERHERWGDAIAMYERGIEVDTLAEDLYRRLMQCHLARRQLAEAARVYRRCREMLSVQLGIAPSAETEALFQTIYKR